jgi:multiple sugar transport system ATP-binding protein
MSRIVLDGITKQYPDGTTAVRSLQLDVGDGELLVLVGPSGCGKTTALRMIAGLEEVTDGTIYIDERPVNDVEPRHRDIAMVFQSYALYPHLSVYDNIAFSLKYRKVAKPEIRRRVEEAARILELEEHLQRKPRQLSGGQRQRVAMGRAIVRQPRAFLMDEPLSNLDAKLRVQMRAEIARLQRALGITTVYVTHDQTEAMTLGSRVAVLSRGVLQQVAPPQELYRRPVNLFVAGFIGSPAMNLLKARLERGDERGDLGGPTPRASTSGPDAVFGGHRLRIPQQALADHPALERYLGRNLILGIRPEHLEDASLLHDPDPESVIELPVELREELGSEVHVHCAVGERSEPADPAEAAQPGGAVAPVSTAGSGRPAGAAGAADPAEVPHAAEAAEALRKVLLVAKMDPRTTVKEGEAAKIAVNLGALHFFDPDTGERIGG